MNNITIRINETKTGFFIVWMTDCLFIVSFFLIVA